MFFQLKNLNQVTFPELPECCVSCGWWQGYNDGWDEKEARSWIRTAEESFGCFGKLACGDDKLLGIIQYGPASLFARKLSPGPPDKDSILLTCSLISEEALESVRKSLVLAVLAELRERDFDTVEAFCYQVPEKQGRGHLFEQKFLRDCGFYPVRSSGGIQLMRLELGGVQPVRHSSLRHRLSILERIKRPSPAPAPVAFGTIEAPAQVRVPACL
jgi:hypothetical protein